MKLRVPDVHRYCRHCRGRGCYIAWIACLFPLHTWLYKSSTCPNCPILRGLRNLKYNNIFNQLTQLDYALHMDYIYDTHVDTPGSDSCWSRLRSRSTPRVCFRSWSGSVSGWCSWTDSSRTSKPSRCLHGPPQTNKEKTDNVASTSVASTRHTLNIYFDRYIHLCGNLI